jgi:hypothetical protein
MTNHVNPLADKFLLAFVKVSHLRNPEHSLPLLAAYSRTYPLGWESVSGSEDFFKMGKAAQALLPVNIAYNATWGEKMTQFDLEHKTDVKGWVERLAIQCEYSNPVFLHWAEIAGFSPAYN